MDAVTINAVIFPEMVEDRAKYIAQGLEYDICAQGDSIEAVTSAFNRAVIASIIVSAELKMQPLETIEAAPKKFWDMYRAAQMRVNPERTSEPRRLPHQMSLPEIRHGYKLLERAA